MWKWKNVSNKRILSLAFLFCFLIKKTLLFQLEQSKRESLSFFVSFNFMSYFSFFGKCSKWN